jgi:hypothetical protein
LEEVVSGFVSKASPSRQAENRWGRIRTRKAECNVKRLASVAAALAVNEETSSRRGFTPFSQIFRDGAMASSRFWNFRTQAEQTPSESGERDSAGESMFDPLTGAGPQLECADIF